MLKLQNCIFVVDIFYVWYLNRKSYNPYSLALKSNEKQDSQVGRGCYCRLLRLVSSTWLLHAHQQNPGSPARINRLFILESLQKGA